MYWSAERICDPMRPDGAWRVLEGDAVDGGGQQQAHEIEGLGLLALPSLPPAGP